MQFSEKLHLLGTNLVSPWACCQETKPISATYYGDTEM